MLQRQVSLARLRASLRPAVSDAADGPVNEASATDWFVIALGLPDGNGEGPLAGEVVPMPPGAIAVTTRDIDEVPVGSGEEHTYNLWHLAVPPRSSKRYHVLVPSTMCRWEQVFATTARMLVETDDDTRKAIACPDALCELTSLENVVES